jgi:hypothetical protein
MRYDPVSFNVAYSREVVRQAAHAFRAYQVKRYGLLMVSACIINAVGLALAVRFGAEPGLVLNGVIFVVILGPSWLLYQYFLSPRLYEIKHQLILEPSGLVVVDPEAVHLPARRGIFVLRWSALSAVLETPAFFLLVLSPFSAYFVPRLGMPGPAYDVFHFKTVSRAA